MNKRFTKKNRTKRNRINRTKRINKISKYGGTDGDDKQLPPSINDKEFEQLPPPVPLMQQVSTGFNVPSRPYYLMRSVLSTGLKQYQSGSLDNRLAINFDKEIKNVFTGILEESWAESEHTTGSLEIIGTPSTLVVADTNILIASQIYPAKYNTIKDDITATTISEYYEQITAKKFEDISWLGFPSMVFSYQNRELIASRIKEKFKDYTGTCISFLFGPFSFHSTEVIAEIGNKEFETNEFLTTQEKHRIFRDITSNVVVPGRKGQVVPWERELLSRTPVSPLTTMDEAAECMRNEQTAMNILQKCACGTAKKGYIRYNEVWSFFYPWDMCGIETGLISIPQCRELLTKLIKAKEEFTENLEKVEINEELVEQINASGHINIALNPNKSQFLFIKYIKECFPKNMNASFNLEQSLEYLSLVKSVLLEILGTIQYDLYTYSIGENGYYSLEPFTVEKPFLLYEQFNDTEYSKISYVFDSTHQLSKDTPLIEPSSE